jgi:DNA-binding transcriptional LysR family regulator
MDLIDGMRTFVAAVEAGSFTAAADRLGISKKLVSKYIAELENRVGARLLNRTTRRLSLTAAGELYFSRATALLEDLEAIDVAVRSERASLTGTVRLAAPATFGELYVVPLLRELRSREPGLTIDLRLSDRYVDLVHEGFDLAIRIGNLTDSRLLSRRFSRTELWVVAAPSYLDAKDRPLVPDDLARHHCLRDTNFRGGASWPFLYGDEMRRVSVAGNWLVDSARAMRDLAVAGDGIALCPDYMVAADLSHGRLERVLAEYPSGTLDINGVFLASRHMPAKTRALLDYLSTRLRDCRDWITLLDPPGPE